MLTAEDLLLNWARGEREGEPGTLGPSAASSCASAERYYRPPVNFETEDEELPYRPPVDWVHYAMVHEYYRTLAQVNRELLHHEYVWRSQYRDLRKHDRHAAIAKTLQISIGDLQYRLELIKSHVRRLVA